MTLVLSNLPIDILAGNKAIIRRHDDIFSEISISFINDLSKLLNQNRDASYADINSLGFWLRNRNIKKYAKRYVDYKKRRCFFIQASSYKQQAASHKLATIKCFNN